MATKSLLKATHSKTVKRDPLFMDEKYIGEEPIWDNARALEFTDEKFEHHLRDSWRYYNYFYSSKDMKKYVIAWVKENMKLTKKQLDAYISSNAELTPMTICGMVKATSKGMPLKDKYRAYIVDTVNNIVAHVDPADVTVEIAKPKVAKYTGPTIQDRLAEKTADVIGELEGQVDNVFKNKALDFKIYEFLTTRSVPQAQVGKIRNVFQKQIDEITMAVAGSNDQLVEGYSHLSKADLKRVGDFYLKLLADLDSYSAVKKAVKKARVKAPKSKDKQVAKVKFMKECKTLKLVSINPADIIGATEVWAYDTKYRKLYRYVADSHIGTLGIKGTSIVGFDEAKSVGKTLRKPDEQLKELMKAGKIALRTFMASIKAVEVKATGRISDRHLLLKAG